MDAPPYRRPFAALIALLAWSALALQLALLLHNATLQGRPFLNATGEYFSYFTILTNLLAAIVTTAITLSRAWRRPALEAATAVYIAFVGLGYSLLLRHLWAPTGLQKLADGLLHDALPLLFLVWWLLAGTRAKLPWSLAATFLIWPAIYLAAALTIGALTGWYPYYFINANSLGYPKVSAIAAGFLLVFLLLSILAITWSRWRSNRIPTDH